MTNALKNVNMTEKLHETLRQALITQDPDTNTQKGLEILKISAELEGQIKYNSERDSVQITSVSTETSAIELAANTLGEFAYFDHNAPEGTTITVIRLSDELKG